MAATDRSTGKNASAPSTEPVSDRRVGLYKDAYDEGKRALAAQFSQLDSMRQRSVQFVAFVGSATAFLIGTGLAAASGTSRTGVFFALAGVASLFSLVMLVALVAVLLAAVITKRGVSLVHWNEVNSSAILVRQWIDPDVGASSEKDFYRDLAILYDEKWEENEPNLRKVGRIYVALLASGTLQIIAWSLVVWVFA